MNPIIREFEVKLSISIITHLKHCSKQYGKLALDTTVYKQSYIPDALI